MHSEPSPAGGDQAGTSCSLRPTPSTKSHMSECRTWSKLGRPCHIHGPLDGTKNHSNMELPVQSPSPIFRPPRLPTAPPGASPQLRPPRPPRSAVQQERLLLVFVGPPRGCFLWDRGAPSAGTIGPATIGAGSLALIGRIPKKQGSTRFYIDQQGSSSKT